MTEPPALALIADIIERVRVFGDEFEDSMDETDQPERMSSEISRRAAQIILAEIQANMREAPT